MGGGISKTDADASYIDQAELKAYLDNQKYLQNAALADYVTKKALADAGYVTPDYLNTNKYMKGNFFNITDEQANNYFTQNTENIAGMYYNLTRKGDKRPGSGIPYESNSNVLALMADGKFVVLETGEPAIGLSRGKGEDRQFAGITPSGLFFEGPKQTNLGIRLGLDETAPIHIQDGYGIYQAGPKGIKLNDWSISPDDSKTKLCFKNSQTKFEYCLGSSANPTLPTSYIRRRY